MKSVFSAAYKIFLIIVFALGIGVVSIFYKERVETEDYEVGKTITYEDLKDLGGDIAIPKEELATVSTSPDINNYYNSYNYTNYTNLENSDLLGGKSAQSFLRSDEDDFVERLLTFQLAPRGTGIGDGSIYVNPLTAEQGQTLFGIALGGVEKFKVDSEGDVNISGNLDVSGTITGNLVGSFSTGFTQGSVAFSDASGNLAQDNSNFFWDDTNNRLGIGTNIPSVNMEFSSSGATTFRLTTSSSNSTIVPIFQVGSSSTNWELSANGSGGGTGARLLYNRANPNAFQIGSNASSPTTDLQIGFMGSGGTAGLSFLTQNTSRLYINSSGNVGIGTTSPTSKLHTEGTYAGNALARFNETGSNDIFTASASGTTRMTLSNTGNLTLGTSSEAQISLNQAGSAVFNEQGNDADFRIEGDTDANLLFVDASTDRVGIGISSPNARAEIRTSSAGKALIITDDVVGSTIGRALAFYNYRNSPDAGGLLFGDGSGWKFHIGKSSDNGLTKYVTFQDNGNVGIGTTSPNDKLESLSTSDAQLRLAYDTSNYQAMQVASDGGLTWSALGTDADLDISFAGATDGDFSINSDDLFVDTSSGSVGIGTTSPNQKLEIQQSNTGVKVTPLLISNPFNTTSTEVAIGFSPFSVTSIATGDISLKNRTGAGVYDMTFRTWDGAALADRVTIYGQSGLVGIGTSSPGYLTEISGAMTSTASPLISITDTTALAQGNGGGLIFRGKYNSGGTSTFGVGIRAEKDTATDGEYGYNLGFYTRTNGVGNFGNAKMLVDADGNVGIGTIQPSGLLDLNAATDADTVMLFSENDTTRWTLFNDGNNSDRFYITDDDGDNGMYIDQDATSWTANSDARLKENILQIDGVLDRLSGINAYTYNFIGTGKTEVGVLAQEIQDVFPELVSQGSNGYLGVTYDRLSPILLSAVKELDFKFNAFEQPKAVPLGYSISPDDPEIKKIYEKLEAEYLTKAELENHLSFGENIINIFSTVIFKAKAIYQNSVEFIADATFRGSIRVNADTAGEITIPANTKKFRVRFAKQFSQTPIVYLNSDKQEPQTDVSILLVTQDYFEAEVSPTVDREIRIKWIALLSDAVDPEKLEIIETSEATTSADIEIIEEPSVQEIEIVEVTSESGEIVLH